MTGNMVQYSVLPNCTNSCKFCLCRDKRVLTTDQILQRIDRIADNIQYIDWAGKFCKGISLLGGEVYGYRDERYETRYLQLLEDICNKILKVAGPGARYSTVTNGIYKPDFLFRCADLVVSECGIKQLDVNFSYDIKYRYSSEKARLQALNNINAFAERYNYRVGVQMILTQHVINSVFDGSWNMQSFIENDIPGNQLVFLYPHPIRTQSLPLEDFFFKRADFLKFLAWLEANHQDIHGNTILSTKNSGTFKYTGLFYPEKDSKQPPILADGKEVLQECGHSVLYKCYSDSDKCMLCDIQKLWPMNQG